MNRRANILTENIIFIILNLVFLAILLVFVFSKTGAGAVLEEKYAKEISLMIDSAKPGMTMELMMKKALEEAEKKNMPLDEVVSIDGNVVTVKLDQDSKGYRYSFFNNASVDARYVRGEKRYDFFIT